MAEGVPGLLIEVSGLLEDGPPLSRRLALAELESSRFTGVTPALLLKTLFNNAKYGNSDDPWDSLSDSFPALLLSLSVICLYFIFRAFFFCTDPPFAYIRASPVPLQSY